MMDELAFDIDYHIEEDSDASTDDDLAEQPIEEDRDSEHAIENQLNEYREHGSLENLFKTVEQEDEPVSRVPSELEACIAGRDAVAMGTMGAPLYEPEDLYDEDIDKDNERWMREKRAKYSKTSTTSQPSTTSASKSKSSTATPSKSDALLCCPACMTTVCIDCQRHDTYKNQFRAMFVMNCSVAQAEMLRYEKKNWSKKRRKRDGPGQLVALTDGCGTMPGVARHVSVPADGDELYHPVRCDECKTELAVYDQDEVYHFFNVLESIS